MSDRTLITGGAGFVGSNLAHALAGRGDEVLLLDNLSRAHVTSNVGWLEAEFPGRVLLVRGDVRDNTLVNECVASASRVFHFAAQVAVTTSLTEPTADFEINARGTLNILEALRKKRTPTPLVYTSTNKVYGELADVALETDGARYAPFDVELRHYGVSERRPLDFHSPYGCSKGAADQYVIDYARTFGLPAVVFRMSCVYGQRQFGNEDQGWVAHFMLRALRDEAITVYGDGRQVRDVLYVSDLVDAFLRVSERMDRVSGRAFNVGGGPTRALSLQQLLAMLTEMTGRAPRIDCQDWRPGDQRFYTSDTRALEAAVGWRPQVSIGEGLERLRSWMRSAGLMADGRGARAVATQRVAVP